MTTIWWRGRTKSRSPSRSTFVFVAMLRAMSGTLPARSRRPHSAGSSSVPGEADGDRAEARRQPTTGDDPEEHRLEVGRGGDQADQGTDEEAHEDDEQGAEPLAEGAPADDGSPWRRVLPHHPCDRPGEGHQAADRPTDELGPLVPGHPGVLRG